jgi:hypothetical protein
MWKGSDAKDAKGAKEDFNLPLRLRRPGKDYF